MASRFFKDLRSRPEFQAIERMFRRPTWGELEEMERARFSVWQEQECTRLGLSREEHDQLVDVCRSSGVDYDFVCSIITAPSLADFERKIGG